MLLREAVSPVPDAVAARRVGIALAAVTVLVIAGGTYAALRNHRMPVAQTPTILIANHPVAVIEGTATPEDFALVRTELDEYRYLFYAKWVMANEARSCPQRLLELNRFDARLHAVDPWGTPYQFLCGVQYRPTFQVRSAGVDRAFDTEDDVLR